MPRQSIAIAFAIVTAMSIVNVKTTQDQFQPVLRQNRRGAALGPGAPLEPVA